MSFLNDSSLDGPAPSARQLLERFCYGHSGEVEAILRFAHDHGLAEDNLVFLLTSILKGNENLVECLLKAIVAVNDVIDNSRQSGTELRKLAQVLVAQIDAAASRSTGGLNIAADRMTSTVQKVEALCAAIITANRDLVQVEGALNRAVELGDGKRALDNAIDQIRRQALADVRGYHAEIVQHMASELRRGSWGVHAYRIVLLIVNSVICWQFIHG